MKIRVEANTATILPDGTFGNINQGKLTAYVECTSWAEAESAVNKQLAPEKRVADIISMERIDGQGSHVLIINDLNKETPPGAKTDPRLIDTLEKQMTRIVKEIRGVISENRGGLSSAALNGLQGILDGLHPEDSPFERAPIHKCIECGKIADGIPCQKCNRHLCHSSMCLDAHNKKNC